MWREMDLVGICISNSSDSPRESQTMWREMDLVRIYTKKVGSKPDFSDPVVLSHDRGGVSVGALCRQVHKVRRVREGMRQWFLLTQAGAGGGPTITWAANEGRSGAS